jgi:hypothetical protein
VGGNESLLEVMETAKEEIQPGVRLVNLVTGRTKKMRNLVEMKVKTLVWEPHKGAVEVR